MKTLTIREEVKSIEGAEYVETFEELNDLTVNLLTGNWGEHWYLYCQDYVQGLTFNNDKEAVDFFKNSLISIIKVNNLDKKLIKFIKKNTSEVNYVILKELHYNREEYKNFIA